MILGIDASTSIFGWCILNEDGSYVDIGYIDLKKCKDLYEKIDVIEGFVKQFSRLTKVVIEAPLQRSNNQNVINLLQRWNGMVCAIFYHHFRNPPILVEQRSALKHMNIKISKGIKGLERKKYILQEVKKYLPDNIWKYARTGNFKPFCYDMADAFVIARSSYINGQKM